MYFSDHISRFERNIRNYYGPSIKASDYKSFFELVTNIMKNLEIDTHAKWRSDNKESYFRVTLMATSDSFKIDDSIKLYGQLYVSDAPKLARDRKCALLLRKLPIMNFGKVGEYTGQLNDLKNKTAHSYDDIIYIDDANNILEATTSNIIVINLFKKTFATSLDNTHLYEGVIIKKVKSSLAIQGFEFDSSLINLSKIDQNCVVLMSNSVNLLSQAFFDHINFDSKPDFVNLQNQKILELSEE